MTSEVHFHKKNNNFRNDWFPYTYVNHLNKLCMLLNCICIVKQIFFSFYILYIQSFFLFASNLITDPFIDSTGCLKCKL